MISRCNFLVFFFAFALAALGTSDPQELEDLSLTISGFLFLFNSTVDDYGSVTLVLQSVDILTLVGSYENFHYRIGPESVEDLLETMVVVSFKLALFFFFFFFFF